MLAITEVFWPRVDGNIYDVVIVLDEEDERSIPMAANLKARFPYVQIAYEPPGDAWSEGHGRQQWTTFRADLYTNATFVAVVDCDTTFTSLLTYNSLFDAIGRPYVKGVIGRPSSPWWEPVPANTALWLHGAPEVFRAMSYFPVIFRRSDLPLVREILEKLHGKSFYEIFKDFGQAKFAQFSIILNAVFYHDNASYAWRFVEPVRPSDPQPVAAGAISMEELERIRSHEEFMNPIVIPAMHQMLDRRWEVVVEGYCYMVKFADASLCGWMEKDRSRVRTALFVGDAMDTAWTYHPGCAVAQRVYYAEVDALMYNFSEHQLEIVREMARRGGHGVP